MISDDSLFFRPAAAAVVVGGAIVATLPFASVEVKPPVLSD